MPEAHVGTRPDRLKRSIRQIGLVRLIVTLLFVIAGLYIARFSWQVPLTSDAERGLTICASELPLELRGNWTSELRLLSIMMARWRGSVNARRSTVPRWLERSPRSTEWVRGRSASTS